ncbi:MAG: DUF4252 domain-containing protein [Proteobacteria bacterium]|nr:DUF4252 domain-containing protein [Pseudomonadota bacterium]
MKHLLHILLISLLLATTSTVNAQTQIDSFESLIGAQPTVEINLGAMMLGLLSSATEGEQGISSILSGLDSIKVTVYELEKTNKNNKINAIKSKINAMADLKLSSGYEKLATVREEDSLVYVLAKMDKKSFKSLSVFALDDESELVLIEIKGAILLSQLGDLIGHFNVDLDMNGLKFNKQKKKDQ